MEVKDTALRKATTGLSEYEQNLTAAAIRANISETENALIRAKVAMGNARLSALKLLLEGKDAALVNATTGLTLQKQNLNATKIRVKESEIENGLLLSKISNAEKMLSLAKL